MIHTDCWKSRRVNFQLELRSFEFLCARIDVKPTSILVVIIYRVQPISESFQDFKKLLEKLVTIRCPIAVVGDFNIHLEPDTVKFNEYLQSFGLEQHVSSPTIKSAEIEFGQDPNHVAWSPGNSWQKSRQSIYKLGNTASNSQPRQRIWG